MEAPLKPDRAKLGTQRCVMAGAVGLLTVALLGCAPAEQAVEVDEAPVQDQMIGRVVFDMGHGEIFGADDISPLGQSAAVGLIRDAGFHVEVLIAPITDEVLTGAAGLILAGPMQALTPAETDAVERYVRGGGTVLITLHVPFPVMSLPARLGVPVATGILRSEMPADPTDDGVFVARDIADDPLVDGVDGVFVVSGWGLEAGSRESTIVVASGEDTWVDVDGDGQRGDADIQGSIGVVGVARFGAGTAVIIGDDGVFANMGIVEEDNARLFDNIVQLMVRSGRSV